jgi:acyl carrier protein
MVPSTIMAIDALPLTPNGKIDRRRLPSPSERQTREYEAPTNDLEKQVADVWKESLGLEAVGRDDNFFDIGGHSLLVVQTHRRLRDVLDRPLSLTDMYRFPTVRSLAQFLDEGDSGAAKKGADRAARRLRMRQRAR